MSAIVNRHGKSGVAHINERTAPKKVPMPNGIEGRKHVDLPAIVKMRTGSLGGSLHLGPQVRLNKAEKFAVDFLKTKKRLEKEDAYMENLRQLQNIPESTTPQHVLRVFVTNQPDLKKQMVMNNAGSPRGPVAASGGPSPSSGPGGGGPGGGPPRWKGKGRDMGTSTDDVIGVDLAGNLSTTSVSKMKSMGDAMTSTSASGSDTPFTSRTRNASAMTEPDTDNAVAMVLDPPLTQIVHNHHNNVVQNFIRNENHRHEHMWNSTQNFNYLQQNANFLNQFDNRQILNQADNRQLLIQNDNRQSLTTNQHLTNQLLYHPPSERRDALQVGPSRQQFAITAGPASNRPNMAVTQLGIGTSSNTVPPHMRLAAGLPNVRPVNFRPRLQIAGPTPVGGNAMVVARQGSQNPRPGAPRTRRHTAGSVPLLQFGDGRGSTSTALVQRNNAANSALQPIPQNNALVFAPPVPNAAMLNQQLPLVMRTRGNNTRRSRRITF